MKRNKFFMLGIVTVLVAVLSLTFVSNTFAKYTSTVTGSDSARVAKWAWKYQNANMDLTQDEVTFELFNTINDTKDGAAEGDVAAGLIAPGTKGSFQISFENESEVKAKLAVTFDEGTNDIPLEFSFNEDFSDAKANISQLSWEQELAVDSAAVTKTVYWRWVFEKGTGSELDANDAADTTLGINTPTINIEMTVVFTQVD